MKYLFLFFLTILIGCSSEKEEVLTFIGGRVVNPNSDFIIIEHRDQVLDTIPLDSQNNFGYEFLQGIESIYTFKHNPESQNVYLKPGDSTVLRVNTIEFDESLSFGGSSSIENNFLMDMFLLNEQDNDLILSYYKISPTEFIEKTDSIMSLRLNNFEKLKSKSEFTPFFEKIAISTIKYEHYDMRERYAFLMKKYVPNKFEEFPEEYFDYRDLVDFNDSNLVSNYSYMRFLDNYLRNKSIEICETENRDCFDLNDHQNLKRRLNLVREIFDDEYLKLNFFNRFIRREIVFSQTKNQLEETLAIIKKFELPALDEQELHQLTSIQSNYLVGNDLKNMTLRTPSLDTIQLYEVADTKPTIMYTWSALSFEGKRNNMNKIKELRLKYPEINFISINLDFHSSTLWRRALRRFNYPPQTEFQVISTVSPHNYSFFGNYLNRVYILDKNHRLTNNSLSLFDPKLESQILNILNQ